MSQSPENRVKDILSRIIEIRKAIDESLLLQEKNISLKDINGTNKKEIDALVWNGLGTFFLYNGMYLDALKIYEHMLQTVWRTESNKGVSIHKGLPLHNIGVAQINLRNYDEGIPNILRAYEEDVETFGQTNAEKMLASRVAEGLYKFVSKVVDNNYLTEFNRYSGLNIKNTITLMQNMNEAEKLFFAKIINSKKLVTFHDDIYTRVTTFDNLKNLCLLLESNLRRRSKGTDLLPGLIINIFQKEPWEKYYETNKALKNFDRTSAVADFEQKLEKIAKLKAAGKPDIDFVVSNFLTTVLVRNFTAHYLNEKLKILSDPKKYDEVFAREIFAVLYSLHYPVK